jgi:hypothetical protein
MKGSSSKINSIHTLRTIKYLVFVLTLSLITTFSFQTLASDPPPFDERDPVGDKSLPDWCPPSANPGLAVVCGTVVSSNVRDVGQGLELPFIPIKNVMVAAYEDNPNSSTGALAGELTNVFSSTKTNGMGRFRLAVRRVHPPNLKVALLFFCGPTKVQELIIDSWHNTWDLFVQADCKPNTITTTRLPATSTETSWVDAELPPFPYQDPPSTSFLGCTNKPFVDTAVGLEKRYQPVINTVITEDNYDHRFTLNPMSVSANYVYFFGAQYKITSPGGLWEPDCLLRNKRGVYMCRPQSCQTWQAYPIQPCTSGFCPSGETADQHMINGSYKAVKLYARTDCTTGPNGEVPLGDAALCEQLKAQESAPEIQEGVDGTMCDSGPFSKDQNALDVMPPEDYVTRPFFKYIPKDNTEASIPFRRFEYRNNFSDFRSDPYSPDQYNNLFFGSSHNSGKGFPLKVFFRSFLGNLTPEPILFSCRTLFAEKNPFQDRNVGTTVNGLINAGPFSGLSMYPTGSSPMEEMYYSGVRDLSDYICETVDGRKVRICEIQPPFGDAQLCEVGTPGCKDKELRSRLNQSLARAYSASSMLNDLEKEQRRANIQNTLAKCTGPFKVDKLHFRFDKIFGTGNTQLGIHSDTPNDSLGTECERRAQFEPNESEQECPMRTGSRVAMQEGGDTKATSFNSVASSIAPQHFINKHDVENFGDVLSLPYNTAKREDREREKERYMDQTSWTIDVVGGNPTSMCSISNAYNVDITGPEEEYDGSAHPNPNKPGVDPADQGGFFDQLFKGNHQHKLEWSAGTSTWYFSDQAVNRDAIMQGAGPGSPFPDPDGSIRVGVVSSGALVDAIFNSLLVRDVWDSMLTFAGGDARIHDLNFDLKDISSSVEAIQGPSKWKSYGDRTLGGVGSNLGDVSQVTAKPFYTVNWQYPLTEVGFQKSFRLPGEQPDGSYVQPQIRPEEWGPGHECYNFDTIIPQGKVGGTTRELPEGISRTTRLDKCVAFHRVETVQCRCEGILNYEGDVENIECEIREDTYEDRHLVIEDCSRLNRLWCARRQETSRAWENWEGNYASVNRRCAPQGGGCHFEYYRDLRSGDETTGDILPPDDIDRPGFNPHEENRDSDYDPPHIPHDTPRCNPDLMNWDNIPPNKEPLDTVTKSRTLSSQGPDRPRCWSSVAGPFRKYPNFSAANVAPPTPEFAGGQIKNCNGFIRVEDSALRAAQFPPYELDTNPDGTPKQNQTDLDRASVEALKVLMNFSPPYTQKWGTRQMDLLYSEDTNDPGAAEGHQANFWTKRLRQSLKGLPGERATVRAFFAYPSVLPVTRDDIQLQPMLYHCEYFDTITPSNNHGLQREVKKVLTAIDPDFDLAPGWNCRVEPPPLVQIPDLSIGRSACAVPEFGKCSQYFRELWAKGITESTTLNAQAKAALLADLSTFQFPIHFRNSINWAAEQTKTPAGALMAVLYLEGGLSNPLSYKDWGDNATVYKMGVPWWGQMDLGGGATCNNLEWTATGPYKIIKNQVACLVDPYKAGCDGSQAGVERSNMFCNVLNRAGGGRCVAALNAGRCNFVDASVIAAFLMNTRAGKSNDTCNSFDLPSALSLYSGGTYGGAALNVAYDIFKACGAGLSSSTGSHNTGR